MSDYRNEPYPLDGLELPELEPPKDLKEHIFRAVAEEMVKEAATPSSHVKLVPDRKQGEPERPKLTAKKGSNEQRTRLRRSRRNAHRHFSSTFASKAIACAGLFFIVLFIGWTNHKSLDWPWNQAGKLSLTHIAEPPVTRPVLFHEMKTVSFMRLGTWNPERTRLSTTDMSPLSNRSSLQTTQRLIAGGIRTQNHAVFAPQPITKNVQSTDGPMALISTDGSLMLTRQANQYCIWKNEGIRAGGSGVQSSRFDALVNADATMMLTIDGQNLRTWKLTSTAALQQRPAQGPGTFLNAATESCGFLTSSTPPTG